VPCLILILIQVKHRMNGLDPIGLSISATRAYIDRAGQQEVRVKRAHSGNRPKIYDAFFFGRHNDFDIHLVSIQNFDRPTAKWIAVVSSSTHPPP
jgi:hypothetical protein